MKSIIIDGLEITLKQIEQEDFLSLTDLAAKKSGATSAGSHS
ncbi:MAG: hypothetical protein AAF399_08075 [Bacteroidota bacterium]